MPPNRPRVLIVDDEPHIVELLADALGRHGLDCSTATTVGGAREKLAREPFGVLIVDVYMPDGSGLELLAHVRAACPRARVIMMSGLSNTQCLAEALSLGAYDYLQKPLDMGRLVESVEAAAAGEDAGAALPLRAARAMQREAHAGAASLETIAALVQAVEAKDPYTRRHSEQVAHYSTNLAACLGLPKGLIEIIRTAALLHDVGKIGVPDRVLTKPGPLDEEESLLIRRHPVLGAEILEKVATLAAEARLIRYHHERWDGSGYPERLVGDEIPLGARIINISDAMDAMLMMRTYKLPFSVRRMLGELRRCAGAHFEPELVQVAIRWCRGHRNLMILPAAA